MMSSPTISKRRILAAGALAAMIAGVGAAFAIEKQKREAERHFPPTGRFVSVRGVRLHYIDIDGPGQPVVLLHGNGAMIADMAISGLVANVSSRYRTVVFDRPGYGYSDRPRRLTWGAREQAHLLMAA